MTHPNFSPDPEVTQDDIDGRPWKYVGYRGFTRNIASSRSFFFVRQFRTLNARVILAMQDQLVVLEGKLNTLDNAHSLKQANHIHNGSFRLESVRERAKLIWNIKRRLKDYNEYIGSYTQIGSRDRVAEADIQSLKNWQMSYVDTTEENYPKNGAIDEKELEYLKTGDDLIYITPKVKSPLRGIYQQLAARLGLFRRKPTDLLGYDTSRTILIEERRAEKVMFGVIILTGLLMLVGPLWILEFVDGSLQKLGVISSFVVLFLALLSFTTTAKPFEILAGAAAYSAVLIVFLGFSPINGAK